MLSSYNPSSLFSIHEIMVSLIEPCTVLFGVQVRVCGEQLIANMYKWEFQRYLGEKLQQRGQFCEIKLFYILELAHKSKLS